MIIVVSFPWFTGQLISHRRDRARRKTHTREMIYVLTRWWDQKWKTVFSNTHAHTLLINRVHSLSDSHIGHSRLSVSHRWQANVAQLVCIGTQEMIVCVFNLFSRFVIRWMCTYGTGNKRRSYFPLLFSITFFFSSDVVVVDVHQTNVRERELVRSSQIDETREEGQMRLNGGE